MRLLAAALVLVLGAGAAAAQDRRPLLSDTGLDHVTLSPDGARVAYLASVGDRALLRVQGLDGRPVASFAAPTQRVRELAWASPEHLLVTVEHKATHPAARLEAGSLAVMAFNVPSRTFVTLLQNKSAPLVPGYTHRSERVLPIVMSRPVMTPDPLRAHVASLNLNGSCALSLYGVDLATGAARVISQGSQDTQAWVVRRSGGALARAVQDDRGWRVLFAKGGGWVESYRAPEGQTATLAGLGREPDSVLVTLQAPDLRRTLVELSGVNGTTVRQIPTGFVQPDPIFDPNTGQLVALRANTTGGDAYEFADARHAQIWSRLERLFPGSALKLQAWTPDFSRVVIGVEGALGREHHVYDQSTGLVRLLAGPAIGEARRLDYQQVTAAALPSPSHLCRAARSVSLTGLQTVPVGVPRHLAPR